MQIQVQLFSILRDLLPPGTAQGKTTVTLPDGATLSGLISSLGIDQRLGCPPEEIAAKTGWQVMLADRVQVDMGRRLHEGDDVKILPPIAGG